MKLTRITSAVCAAVFAAGAAGALPVYDSPCAAVYAEDISGVVIEQQSVDFNDIPDSYNTGCRGELTKVGPNDNICGIQLKQGGDKVSAMIDLKDRDSGISGEIVIENYDFSDFALKSRLDNEVDRDVKLIFRNCKFSSVEKGKAPGRVIYEFDHCTMKRFSGGNAKLDRCALGGSYYDALLPFCNVEVNNCYISDMTHKNEGGEVHTDGTQIYGTEGVEVSNIHFEGCRFEMPYIQIDGSNATMNACIMLQLEYSSGHDISFRNCVLNGGGTYSIYATIKNKKDGSTDWKLENVTFENIKVGCSAIKSAVYSSLADGVELKGLSAADALYVTSVHEENGSTVLYVTNDTNTERKLKIVTPDDEYDYTISACPTGKELLEKKVTSFGDMPADVRITVPGTPDYLVCLDVTDMNDVRQIRCVKNSDVTPVLDKELFGGDEALGSNILYEGSCGKDVAYTVSKDHVLTISGTGAMDNYHSQKLSPWDSYAGTIKKIVVTEGVKAVGNMAFRGCYGAEEVILPEGLESVGGRAFGECMSLRSITIPESADDIDDNAFAGLANCEIIYIGREDESSTDSETDSSTDESSSSEQDDSSTPDEPEEDFIPGDVNGDGKITVTDLSQAAAHIKSVKMLTEEQQKRAEVNRDGRITVTDLSMIAAHVKGIKELG